MQGFRVREAAAGDAEGLAAVHVAAWREAYAGVLPEAMLAGLSVEARAAAWAKILGEGQTWVRAAEDGSRIVGFVAACAQRDAGLAQAGFGGEVSAIYRLRSHQGLGLGRALMRAAAADLAVRGFAGAALWVLRDNAPARSFYERLGGVVVDEKTEARPAATFVEVAYGWPDLAALLA